MFRFLGIIVVALLFLAGCGANTANDISGVVEVEAAERIDYSHTGETMKSASPEQVAEPQMQPQWTLMTNGTYTSNFDIKQKNRTHNLDVSAKTLDGTIVAPGETFSFNEIIGKATRDKGYKLAKIFIKGKEEQGLGGGICQLSSTLYNAAEQAGLEIVERHPHSRRVYYVPENRDAAVAYGGVDLKIKNNTDKPVRIHSRVQNDECIVEMHIQI
ncbi:MAG: VanW family protein [Defluviitaleaceae bacterium]|nr:VanW family protein [Defluviitaleaceae bacterium]